jgi:hypothetical protein
VAAQRQLYGYYRNPFTDDDSVKDPKRPNLRTVSNTSPIAHAGKLFTLKEDGLPHQINPNTLDTLGPYDFNGQWKSETFTAHPKIDPVTGEMIAFGYEAIKRASTKVPTIVAVDMDRPAILTNVRTRAAALIAVFGASDAAVLDVVSGRARAEGHLPFELPSSMKAVEAQDPAVADDSAKPLYPVGAGGT